MHRCRRCHSRGIVVHRTADASAYGTAYRAGASSTKIARLVELFDASGMRGARLLDIGCADGAFLAAMRSRGWIGCGIDPDPSAIAATRAREIVAHAGGIPDVDLAGEVDAITAWDLIEHTEDPAACARWIARRLTPGGRVVVLTPDAGSMFDRIAGFERAATRGHSTRIDELCLNRYHLHRFSAAGLAHLFETAGLRTVDVRRVQLFSLAPERYGSGFAPGLLGWTGIARLDRLASRLAHAAATRIALPNKLLYVGEREVA